MTPAYRPAGPSRKGLDRLPICNRLYWTLHSEHHGNPELHRIHGRGLAELRREFARRGWTKRDVRPVLAAFILHTVLIFAGMFLGLWAWSAMSGLWCAVVTLVGLAISGVGTVGIATTTHTPSHYAASPSRTVNEIMTYIGYPLLNGFSATYWWRDHVSSHHMMPNVHGADNDFDFLPAFAVTTADLEGSTGWLRTYYQKWQAYVLPPALVLMGANLQRCGWQDLVAVLRNPAKRRRQDWLDFTALICHYGLLIGVPCLFFPISHVLVFYFARMAMVSLGVFVLLVPPHFPMETPVMEKAEALSMGHCALQTTVTVNYNGGWFIHAMAAGMDYQIEHHLFPEMSHIYYPLMSPLVAEYCAANGLQYRTMKLSEALRKSYDVFKYLKPLGVNPAHL